VSGQFPIQFTKPLRRGEPFKRSPCPEIPTTDQAEADWSALAAVLYALAWYNGYMAR
jgi:hypothetical protein